MVKVNNKEMKWQDNMTLEDVILFAEYHEYYHPILVVTLNGILIKSDAFKTTPIRKDDVIDILQPLAGG